VKVQNKHTQEPIEALGFRLPLDTDEIDWNSRRYDQTTHAYSRQTFRTHTGLSVILSSTQKPAISEHRLPYDITVLPATQYR